MVLPRKEITASASSTLPGGYGIAQTLDGRRDTAWNSAGRGAGVTLIYRFDRRVRLLVITIRNGYVASTRSQDPYTANARLRTATVRTEGKTALWRIKDTPNVQSFEVGGTPTRSVTLVVRSVYPGKRYRDLALTDIAFTVVR